MRQSDDNTAKGRKCMQNIQQNRIELFRLSYFNSDVFIEKKGSQAIDNKNKLISALKDMRD